MDLKKRTTSELTWKRVTDMKLDVKYILCAEEELLKCEKLGYTKKEGVTVP